MATPGNLLIENSDGYTRNNEGLRTAYPVYIDSDLTVTGTTNIAGVSLTDLTVTGNTVIGNAGTDTTVITGTFATGESTSADRVVVKGIYMNAANVSVAVPSITDPDSGSVAVDVSAAFTVQPAVGDAVIAIPQAALPADCVMTGAYVTATDTITVAFASTGGNVTGANVNFKFLVVDLT